MTPQQQIQQHMTENHWSIDRMAVELATDTPTLRWFLAGYAPETPRQQERIAGILRALEAEDARRLAHEAIPARPARPARQRVAPPFCRHGHVLDAANLAWNNLGFWYCRICRRASNQRSRNQRDLVDERKRLRLVEQESRYQCFMKLLDILHAHGLSNTEIAHLAGMPRNYIVRWKNRDKPVPADRLDEMQHLVRTVTLGRAA